MVFSEALQTGLSGGGLPPGVVVPAVDGGGGGGDKTPLKAGETTKSPCRVGEAGEALGAAPPIQ